MPRIDELPVPAQNEIRARRGELPAEEHPEKRRTSLLQRLAAVGLGRREPEEEEPSEPASCTSMPLPAAERLPGRPAPRPEPRQESRRESRQNRVRSRSPNTPNARRRRVSTSTDGRPLCITGARKTSSTFRRFCVGRRTDASIWAFDPWVIDSDVDRGDCCGRPATLR